jgi:predicted Zn-dependent protease
MRSPIKHTLFQAVALGLAVFLPAADARVISVSLAELVEKHYLDLLEIAPTVSFRADEFEAVKNQLNKQRDAEKDRLKKEEQELDKRLEELRQQLKSLNQEASADTEQMAGRRKEIHCSIQKLEKERRDKRIQRETGVPVAFDNKLAKLELVRQWPAKKIEVERTIAENRARQRKYGDVEDIGFRKISTDQEKDVKLGEEAIRQLKLHGLVPPEVDDKEVSAYVQGIAQRIASNSDVTVPVKVSVLRSQEINAFAMPGGFLFVDTGLLEKAETESELAGVIAHELAHVSARHGARMMKRATIANIMMGIAQVAAMLVSGGIATIGTYYALQYGFYGLGLVLDLALLGVTREFEAEADQLGTQYAWKAGYDPRGFITFFDKMASEKGYAKSASFFRTHPPFFDRILSTVSEIAYLPESGALAVDSTAYRDFKKHLEAVLKKEAVDRKNKPKLKREPVCDGDETPAAKPELKRKSTGRSVAPCDVCGAEE